jgi:hypothetical protein
MGVSKGWGSMTRISARPAAVAVLTAAGVAALAATALAPAVAEAASHPAAPAKVVNLIKDPGAELAKPDSDGGKVKVPNWTPAKGSQFTATAYGAEGGFPDKNTPGPKHRGKAFFAGGPSGNTSGATQSDSLKSYARLIASGKAKFKLTGWLGGWSDQGDNARLTVTWTTSSGKALGHATIGPVTAAQRHDVTEFLYRATSGLVPKGAATAVLTLHMVRDDGEYIDGYADNLSLTISG